MTPFSKLTPWPLQSLRRSVVKTGMHFPSLAVQSCREGWGGVGLCSQGQPSREGSRRWTSRRGRVMECRGPCRTGLTRSGRRSAGGQVCAGGRCGQGWVTRGPSEWPLGVWLLKAALHLPFSLGFPLENLSSCLLLTPPPLLSSLSPLLLVFLLRLENTEAKRTSSRIPSPVHNHC